MKQPSTHLPSENSPSRKPLGRQRSKATELLSQFLCKRSNKHPKKEIIRCEVIRGIKRSIRQLAEGKAPMKGWHGFQQLGDLEAEALWKQLRTLVETHSQVLLNIANTEAGPKTDGKVIRARGGDKSHFNSFNDAFCRWFYSAPVVRSFHRLYVELVFIHCKAASLAAKLPFTCCAGPEHSQGCAEKWRALKWYLMTDMLAELSPGLSLPRLFLPKILIGSGSHGVNLDSGKRNYAVKLPWSAS